MSQIGTILSKTQQLFNHSSINTQKQSLQQYKPLRALMQQDSPSSKLPIKKFQQYFGKMKPSLFQQIRNIFQYSTINDRSPSPTSQQMDYQIRGFVLTSRSKQVQKRKQQKIKQTNNFMLESVNTKDIIRKAKLNRLIRFHETLEHWDGNDQQTRKLLLDSGQLLSDLKKTSFYKKRYCPTANKISFRTSKSLEPETLLQHLNPLNKQKFTVFDINYALALIHKVEIQISPNITFFNVFVQEGNNAEMLKNLIRRRNGWRVVELPQIANFIWTQFYKKGVLQRRLNKREKSQPDEDKNTNRQLSSSKPKSINKRNDLDTIDLSPKKIIQSNSINQLRKLVPKSEVEDISKMKLPHSKTLKPIFINQNMLIHNHFPQNRCISDKKNLLSNLTVYLKKYNRHIFQLVPESYQLNTLKHPIFEAIEKKSQYQKQLWLVKPGQNSNRGRGISICHNRQQTLQELTKRLKQENQQKGDRIHQKHRAKSVILQKYLRPLLYNGRKFDIRSYMLVTLLNKQLRMYCYDQCYIRTSSKPFDINSTNRLVHLTNDAVQSLSCDYGKYQQGNKVAESLFARFIDQQYNKKTNKTSGIWQQLKSQMNKRCIDVIESSYSSLITGCIKQNQNDHEGGQINFYFQLFGMDFMIDQTFKLWVIEVNTNPAITHDCSRVLNHLIPKMLDNMLTVAVQPIMRPLRVPEVPFNNQFIATYKRELQ